MIDYTQVIGGFDIWQIVKWIYVLAFFVYFLFSVIVWRQIDLMVKTLNGSLQLPMRVLGVVLVLLSGAVLGVGLMVL